MWDAAQNKPEICVYCGYCASYCPYDVLAMEEIAAQEIAAQSLAAGGAGPESEVDRAKE
jgi:ferredoxin